MGLLVDTSGDYVFFPEKLCARRILCFLKRRHLDDAAHQLERETAVFFDMSHLRWLATTARWDDLTAYVDPFLPSPTSFEATAFLHCIHIYSVLGMIAAGGKHADGIDRLHPLLDAAAAKADPHAANLHTFFHKVREHPPRDVRSWMKIWEAAAERLKDLALKCPELKGKLHLQVPKYAPKRWQINLSGVRSVPRAYKEKGNKPKSCDISCFYEQKRREINKRLSGFPSNGTSYSVISDMQIGPSVPEGFSSNGTSRSMISDMQIELAVPEAPEGDTTVVAGMLGGNGSLGHKAEVDASKFKKRKMSAMLETDKDASTRLKTGKEPLL
ncbi:hypothetical protein C2845_PM03G05230 [Panicum miliaceum]|uniref:Uncharacterized protein n=1 Tax=Panicum miliaceum TaxID=4540 RepID=A0A3L6T6U3_PANMI|nr:hypothetical protein C2845_PM03G05230 [Panicum miliaceum]